MIFALGLKPVANSYRDHTGKREGCGQLCRNDEIKAQAVKTDEKLTSLYEYVTSLTSADEKF